ncbi:MAG TPA: hypothetical protein VEL31_09165 [Ktedonobacteraceae bacterium]|nr:hypothetical protein [Ktedonobacteraceae bacterium]
MEWKPDDQYTEDMQQPGYQEPPETIKSKLNRWLIAAIIVLMVVGTVWLALLAGPGK